MKKPRLLMAALLAMSAASASAAEVSLTRGNLTYTESFEEGDITITFAKCMYNNLYTFKNVNLNGKDLNTTSSDNIGPFLVGGMWTGGNHAYPSNGVANAQKTANTISYKIWADDQEISGSAKTECKVLTVEVVNELLYFAQGNPVKFATETMRYRVSGNSIEVWGNHKYEYDKALNVDRYYGMQSMFNGETELLTPGGKMKYWTSFTPGGDANRLEFTKVSAPNFCTFIEHNANGYQASYMTRDGIGDRSMVSAGDIVFTGNNWNKSYHKLIGGRNVKKGDETSWHGIYSWFDAPLIDECRDSSVENPTFAYLAYIDGKPFEMHLDASGKMTQTAGIDDIVAERPADFAFAIGRKIIISDDAPDARCYNMSGMLLHNGSGEFECQPGIYVVNDGKGHSLKLIIR